MSQAVAVQPNEDAAAERIAFWRRHPVEQVKTVYRATPDDWQGDVLEAFPTTPRLALEACVGPGKTALLAWIALNYISTRPMPKIACTSITWANLRDNLWAELAKWISMSDLMRSIVTWNHTKIVLNENPGLCWIAARTWEKRADQDQLAQTLKGLHADYILAIADETGAMPPVVLQAAEGVLATCKEGHIVQAGNPIDRASALYKASQRSNGSWKTFKVTGDPDDPNRAPRVDVDWALEQIQLYGRDSAYVRANVLGLWPLQNTDSLIGLHDIEASRDRVEDKSGEKLARGLRVLGVDVARYGEDATVVCFRNGDFCEKFSSWRNKDTRWTSDRVAALAREYEATHIYVDDIGVGGGVTDNLRRMSEQDDEWEIVIRGVNVGIASEVTNRSGEPMYANLKAEASMTIAQERFQKGRVSLTEEAYTSPLGAEASDIRYGFGAGGKVFKVESKDEYKKRHGGESPDHWDAFVLAFMVRQVDTSAYGWG